jgi:hypothetical protein
VNQPADLVAAERRNHALDLPPVAETRDIALVAAALRARRGLIAGVVAEAVHQLGRIRQREPPVNEGRVHAEPSNRTPVSTVPTNVVNAALTIFSPTAHGGPTMRTNKRAGGCLLMICILAGFPVGLAVGNPMKGILLGTAVGVVLAVALWLIDRERD